MPLTTATATALALVGGLTGCAPAAPAPPERPQLTVAAAASLDAAFTELLAEFAADHPEIEVRPLILDGSSTLVTQLREGAPFDVIATANEATMQSVGDVVETPEFFAINYLVLAVAPGNPLRIRSLYDLAERAEPEGLSFVVCAPEVPCGAAARFLLDSLDTPLPVASEEQSVTAVLAKVRSGEADAGLVYATDVIAADGAVTRVDTGSDTSANQYAPVASTRYQIAVVAESPHEDAARAFVELVVSVDGRDVLVSHGFGGRW